MKETGMMAKCVKPLNNRVLVKRSQMVASKGGILLPDSAQEKPKQGEVVAVGPGKLNDDGILQVMSVKVGDQVLFSSYAGVEVKMEEVDVKHPEETHLILSEEDILGVFV
jgi:chaperonin GroES